VFLIKLFISFTRRHWYRKKRFAIPIGVLTTLFIGAIALGSILGTRTSINPSGIVFAILLSLTVNCIFIQQMLIGFIGLTPKDIEIARSQQLCHFCILFLPTPDLFPSIFQLIAKHSSIVNLGRNREGNIGRYIIQLQKNMIYQTRKQLLTQI
jgi:hypothetical protein